MRYRWIGALLLLLALLWVLSRLLHLDPVRTGLAFLLISGGYRLVRRDERPEAGSRKTLVGVVHLIDREYPLHDIDLSCGVADVKIDLSRAIIPPGEHKIMIRGLVGDVTIYLPYDLEVSVAASVPMGRLHLPESGQKQRFSTSGYAEAVSKVKIGVSLAVGDVDVRYL